MRIINHWIKFVALCVCMAGISPTWAAGTFYVFLYSSINSDVIESSSIQWDAGDLLVDITPESTSALAGGIGGNLKFHVNGTLQEGTCQWSYMDVDEYLQTTIEVDDNCLPSSGSDLSFYCDTDYVWLDNIRFPSRESICYGYKTIDTADNVVIPSSAVTELMAPTITIGPGFTAQAGSTVTIKSGDPLTMRLSTLPQTKTLSSPFVQRSSVNPAEAPSESIRLMANSLPLPLQTKLGKHLEQIEHFWADQDQKWIVFSSDAPLISSDNNGHSDVFVYDVDLDRLNALSTYKGMYGNGPSNWVRIDGKGQWVVYQTLADNLIDDDNNEVSDIVAHHLESGQRLRVSLDGWQKPSDHGSFRPSIAGVPAKVLFTQQDGEDGARLMLASLNADVPESIWVNELDYDAGDPAQAISGALSADGRYALSAQWNHEKCKVVTQDLLKEVVRFDACAPGLQPDDQLFPMVPTSTGQPVEILWYQRKDIVSSQLLRFF